MIALEIIVTPLLAHTQLPILFGGRGAIGFPPMPTWAI
jgi:hypothetical protein